MNHRIPLLALLILVGIAVVTCPAPAQEKGPPPQKASQTQPAAGRPAQFQPTVPVDPENPPVLHIDSKEYDAGDIMKGHVIDHEFLIENRGKGVLEIVNVRPACGCTSTGYDRKIEPGQTGKISLKVDTRNFVGPINKSTTVYTNAPQSEQFQIFIKATVREIIAVKPSANQQFGLVYLGQSLTRDYDLASTDDTPFTITQIECTDDHVVYEVIPSEDRKSAIFRVTLPEDHPEGPVSARFTLKTDHPKVPSIGLNAYGTIRLPLTVYPKELIYGGMSKQFIEENPEDPSLNKPINLNYETASDLEVFEVGASLPFLRAELNPIAEGKRYSVQVRLQPPVEVGDFQGTVTINTNKGEVQVPVKGKIF